MKYKAIFLDIDGTTVEHGRDSVPTEEVVRAISRAKNHVSICFATGRPLAVALPILSALAPNGPCVLVNGVQIYDPNTQKIVKEYTLDSSLVNKAQKFVDAYDAQLYIHDGNEEILWDRKTYPEKILSLYVPEISHHDADRLMNDFNSLPGVTTHKTVAWNRNFMAVDLVHAEATKLHGIVEICRLLGLRSEEIIGVGDGYNDFPLLMACGLKIAMGNAVDELKEIADFIAPTVGQNGVATIIEKLILTA